MIPYLRFCEHSELLGRSRNSQDLRGLLGRTEYYKSKQLIQIVLWIHWSKSCLDVRRTKICGAHFRLTYVQYITCTI